MPDSQIRFIPLVPTSSKNGETETSIISTDASSSLLSGGSYDSVELNSNSGSDDLYKNLNFISTANTAGSASTSNSSVNMSNFNAVYNEYKKARANFCTTGLPDTISKSMDNLSLCVTTLEKIIGDNSVTASDGTVVTKKDLQDLLMHCGPAAMQGISKWHTDHPPYGGVEESIGQASSNNAAMSLNFGLFNSIMNSSNTSTTSYIDKDEQDIANTKIDTPFLSDDDTKALTDTSWANNINFDDTGSYNSGISSSGSLSGLGGNLATTIQDTSKLGTDIFNIKDSALNTVGDIAGQDVKTVLEGGLGALTLADPTGIISGSINLADSFTDAYRDNDTVGGIAGDTVANFGDNLAQNIREVGNGINTIFSDIGLGGVGSAVSGIANTLADGVSGVGNAIGGAIEWAADGISDFFGFGGGSDSGSSSSASSSFSSSSSSTSSSGGGGSSLWRTILSWF